MTSRRGRARNPSWPTISRVQGAARLSRRINRRPRPWPTRSPGASSAAGSPSTSTDSAMPSMTSISPRASPPTSRPRCSKRSSTSSRVKRVTPTSGRPRRPRRGGGHAVAACAREGPAPAVVHAARAMGAALPAGARGRARRRRPRLAGRSAAWSARSGGGWSGRAVHRGSRRCLLADAGTSWRPRPAPWTRANPCPITAARRPSDGRPGSASAR